MHNTGAIQPLNSYYRPYRQSITPPIETIEARQQIQSMKRGSRRNRNRTQYQQRLVA